MQPRTVGALALCPTGNAQGSLFFLSLDTGHVINHLHATAIPMSDPVVEKVHHLARQQKANPGLVFMDRNMIPSNEDQHNDDDSDEDSDYIGNASEEEENNFYDGDKSNDDNLLEHPIENQLNKEDNNDTEDPGIPGVDGVDGTETGINNNPEIPGVAVFADTNPGMVVGNHVGVDALHNGTDIGIKDKPNQEEDENGENHLSGEEQVPTLKGDVEDNEPLTQWYNLCNNRTHNYQYQYHTAEYDLGSDLGNDRTVLTNNGSSAVPQTPQMSMKKGLQAFGDHGLKAMKSEM